MPGRERTTAEAPAPAAAPTRRPLTPAVARWAGAVKAVADLFIRRLRDSLRQFADLPDKESALRVFDDSWKVVALLYAWEPVAREYGLTVEAPPPAIVARRIVGEVGELDRAMVARGERALRAMLAKEQAKSD